MVQMIFPIKAVDASALPYNALDPSRFADVYDRFLMDEYLKSAPTQPHLVRTVVDWRQNTFGGLEDFLGRLFREGHDCEEFRYDYLAPNIKQVLEKWKPSGYGDSTPIYPNETVFAMTNKQFQYQRNPGQGLTDHKDVALLFLDPSVYEQTPIPNLYHRSSWDARRKALLGVALFEVHPKKGPRKDFFHPASQYRDDDEVKEAIYRANYFRPKLHPPIGQGPKMPLLQSR